MYRSFLNTIGLQTPGGRLAFFGIVTVGVAVVPFEWLAQLSLWQHLNIPSPSIGLTRAYKYLLQSDVQSAWQQNKLIFAVLLIGAPLLAMDLRKVVNATYAKAEKKIDR